MINDNYVILKGTHNPTRKMPLFHNGWWKDELIVIDCICSPSWLHFFTDPENGGPLVKANTDIQKLFGYSTDIFRKDIIRIGCSNGYSPDLSRNLYDGKHLLLTAYLTKNWSRVKEPGKGKMIIGRVAVNAPFRIYHQLSSDGRPWFQVTQENKPPSSVLFDTTFSKPSNGLNMNPYVEYDKMGAPEKLDLSLTFQKIQLLDDNFLITTRTKYAL